MSVCQVRPSDYDTARKTLLHYFQICSMSWGLLGEAPEANFGEDLPRETDGCGFGAGLRWIHRVSPETVQEARLSASRPRERGAHCLQLPIITCSQF